MIGGLRVNDLLITVIIPVYNVEKYLDKCISSVVNQTYKNLEIILVDDGSPDRCPEMCDQWAKKDNRIKVIHKENGGQGTARNMALDICTGDYILFIDSDDYIINDMIFAMVNATGNSKYDLVLCGYTVDNGLRTVDTMWYESEFELNNKQLMLEYLKSCKIITGPVCKLFKRKIFDNIRFPNFRANEDAYIMHRLFGKCENAYILNKHLYVQNIREGSTEQSSFNKNKMHLLDCELDMREYITEKYPEHINLVLERPSNAAFLLLNKIIMENDLNKNKDWVTVLEDFLTKEKEYLISEKSNSLSINFIDYYFDKKNAYIFKQKLSGFKFKLRKKIKKLLIKIKNTRGK